MHHHPQHQLPQPSHTRRKKKRQSHGYRNIELVRGTKGYGFTISGQQPCILSCILPDSPADLAGLRSGDYLLAVNGHAVNKAPHDSVVRLIAHSNGLLRLQIADSYYSDSSDDDETNKVRSRPKFRSRSSNASGSSGFSTQPQCRVAKVVRDLQSGAMFDSASTASFPASNSRKWSPLPPPPPASRKRDSEKIVHRAVLGYLGTIDIPSHLQSVSMMSLVRKCIKRIKAENRNPTTVLLTIHVANIKLINVNGLIIAEYPSNRIVFCNYFSGEDKLHFGILTKSNPDELYQNGLANMNISNSCHVFKIYSDLTDHCIHVSTSANFGFVCTKASELNNACQEFPAGCDGLVGAIQTLYISDKPDNDVNLFDCKRNHREAQSSPQPSNISTSTAHSSNSDSGIGFKDEYGCNVYNNFHGELPRFYDRSIVVSSLGRNVKDLCGSKLTVRAISDPRWSDFQRPFTPFKTRSEPDHCQDDRCNDSSFSPKNKSHRYEDDYLVLSQCYGGSKESRRSRGSREGSIVSCPALPSGRSRAAATSAAAHSSEAACSPAALAALARSSPRYTSTLSVGTLRSTASGGTTSRSIGNFLGMHFDGVDCVPMIPDRLSPKVYPNGMKIQGYSMENLKTSPGSKSQVDNYNATMSLPHSQSGKTNDKVTRAWGSMQEIRKVASCKEPDDYAVNHGSTESCDKTPVGVEGWTISFEKLLEDPKGLQTFAKYLKKEISHENIYFWTACERYADTEDVSARKVLAGQIYQRHLSNNASEPVNVDAKTVGRITPDLLNSAPLDLFAQAQKQIFNLMKFDSYPRFLKSDIYQDVLKNGFDNDSVVEDGELTLTNSNSIKLKKTRSNAEDRSRKSILPWNRKNRSKSKDRGESEYNKTPSRGEKIYKSFSTIQRDHDGTNEEDNVSISSSRSSLASWDLALRQSFTKHSGSSCEGQSNENREIHGSKCTGLCRVILPDGSTTVIPTNHTDSVLDVVNRLLDKRALRYPNYDVLMLATDEIINLKYPSSVLANQEVEVVPSKVIKIDLPSRRVISVVAHKGKTLKEVLKPLLNKYGFKLDLVTIWADGHPISVDITAADAPPRLALTSNNKEIIDDSALFKTPEVPQGQPTLDEITNKVFEELRVGKLVNKDDDGSCKSDDQKSDSSSIRSGKFFSRDSTLHIKRKSKTKGSNASEKSNSECGNDESHRPSAPLIAKLRNGVKLQLPSRFDGDGKNLYEGLKRAQRARLEDQRGTEINFELPDFLKENGKTINDKKRRKSRGPSGSREVSKFYDSEEERPILETCFDNSNSFNTTTIEVDKTVIENGNQADESTKMCNQDTSLISPSKLSKPPPLPPKPKSLSNSLRNNVLPSRPFQRYNCDKKTI